MIFPKPEVAVSLVLQSPLMTDRLFEVSNRSFDYRVIDTRLEKRIALGGRIRIGGVQQ